MSLRTCAKNKDLVRGMRIHREAVDEGLAEVCSDTLIVMYAKCGALATAQELLEFYGSDNQSTWTALIAGYVRQKKYRKALDCFESMKRQRVAPSAIAYSCALKACGSLKLIHKGEQVHMEIRNQDLLKKDIVLGTTLVDMYARCGALSTAQEVLEELPSRDIFTWSALITGYARHDQGTQALKCLELMQREGLSPDSTTYSCSLKACGTIRSLEKGQQIHAQLVKQGLIGNDLVLSTALVDMYSKCGSLPRAQQMHEDLPFRDVVSWSALISGYAQQNKGMQALECFKKMKNEGLSPNAITYCCILNACGSIMAADEGVKIHDEIVRRGFLRNDIALGNALIDMYVKCGAFGKAQHVLAELPFRDTVSWGTLILGFIQQDQAEKALKCFEEMQHEGISPDSATMACILKACGMIRSIDTGRKFHVEISKQGSLGNDEMLGVSLIEMYAKCGELVMAERVFEELLYRDVFSWNAIIVGYTQNDQADKALKCYEKMQCQKVIPNALTFASILSACACVGALDKGAKIHEDILKQGLLDDDIVLGNALVNMYAKCCALTKASRVFEELPLWDVVSWNILITGYMEDGQGEEALDCFVHMEQNGILPDETTYICILKACGTLGALQKGQQIHEKISIQGLLQENVVIGTVLVDMYAKCGALQIAEQVLRELPSRDAVSWNALIAGYTQHGLAEEALNCLRQMQSDGFVPDSATLSSVLNACCHLGLVDKCLTYLVEMSIDHGVKPHLEHYTCMVDVFGRAGHLEKAVEIIRELPSSNHCVLWRALLGACHKWGDIKVGRWAFEQAVLLDRSDQAAYVLMYNLYRTFNMHAEAERIEVMRRRNATNHMQELAFTVMGIH
ncbi:hypothetical protein KP509_06G022800 [Ceratopteris richardii]|nr:hypothetical protein KP509_06G022800 [Ceratopteris richardii]